MGSAVKNILTKPIFHAAIIIVVGVIVALAFPRNAPDTGRYLTHARNLYESEIYSLDGINPSVRDVPGLPFVFYVALLLKINPLFFARVLNGFALGCIAFLSARIFCRIFAEEKTVKFTSVILMYVCAFFPTILGPAFFALTELFFTFFFLLGNYLLIAIIFNYSKKYRLILFCGIVFGIAALFRSVGILYPFFVLPLVLFFARSGWKSFVKYAAVVFAGFLIVVSPWIIRNYLAFDMFIPGSADGGKCMYVGTREDWNAEFPDDYNFYENLVDDYAEKSQPQNDKALFNMAVERIKENPVKWLGLMRYKAWNFWLEVPGAKKQIKERGIVYLIKCINWVMLLCFIYGVFSLWKKPEIRVLLIPVIYMFAVHMVLFAMPRFRIPVDPYLILIAFCGIYVFVNRKKNIMQNNP